MSILLSLFCEKLVKLANMGHLSGELTHDGITIRL
jgi:hypothetical protein